jgi:hypothetical protein
VQTTRAEALRLSQECNGAARYYKSEEPVAGPCQTLKYLVFLLFAEWLPLRVRCFRDMMANARNIPKLNYSSILLTMIFSMGEPMPITHHGNPPTRADPI